MSLLIAHIQPEQLLIAVDTLGVDPSGHRFHASKLRVVPHARMVVAARGLQSYLSSLEFHLSEPRAVTGYDSFAPQLHSKMAHIRGALRSEAIRQRVDPTLCDNLELVVAGWSDSERRFKGSLVRFDLALGAFIVAQFDEATPWCFAPCRENDLSFVSLVGKPGGIEAIARSQCAYMAEHPDQAGIAYGGKLIQCVMCERETTITEVCDLG